MELEEENLLFYLDGEAVGGGHYDGRVDLHEGAEFWLTVFHEDTTILECDSSLLSRDTYVWYCDVVWDSPADVEIRLHGEDDHMDSFREALNVRLQDHVLLVLGLLEVKQVDVLCLIWSTNII